MNTTSVQVTKKNQPKRKTPKTQKPVQETQPSGPKDSVTTNSTKPQPGIYRPIPGLTGKRLGYAPHGCVCPPGYNSGPGGLYRKPGETGVELKSGVGVELNLKVKDRDVGNAWAAGFKTVAKTAKGYSKLSKSGAKLAKSASDDLKTRHEFTRQMGDVPTGNIIADTAIKGGELVTGTLQKGTKAVERSLNVVSKTTEKASKVMTKVARHQARGMEKIVGRLGKAGIKTINKARWNSKSFRKTLKTLTGPRGVLTRQDFW